MGGFLFEEGEVPVENDVAAGKLAYSLQNEALYDGSWALTYANAILANPQAHIDALVEAGVLEKRDATWTDNSRPFGAAISGPVYEVVQPHEHDWRVDPNSKPTWDTTKLLCHDCPSGEVRFVPNRLPLKVPA